jgi:hypothetical protein
MRWSGNHLSIKKNATGTNEDASQDTNTPMQHNQSFTLNPEKLMMIIKASSSHTLLLPLPRPLNRTSMQQSQRASRRRIDCDHATTPQAKMELNVVVLFMVRSR